MKNLLIILISVSIGTNMFADDCSESKSTVKGQYVIDTNVPSHLRGATITVTQADGKSSTVPAEKFKVVPRKQQFITAETEKTLVCTDSKKNRVSVLGGRGVQEGIKTTKLSSTTTQAESNVGFVGGLEYQRKVWKDFSIGVQGQSNKTGSLVLGLDF
jgi:hypothetical protein